MFLNNPLSYFYKKNLYFSLLAISLFLFAGEALSQKDIKAKCTAVSRGVRLKNVNFTLLKNNDLALSEYATNGRLRFEIPSKQDRYRLILEKPGYITKEVVFDSEEYPFSRKYNKLNLDLMLRPLEDGGPSQLVYTLGFSRMEGDYIISKVDTVFPDLNKRLKERKSNEKEENRLQAIYDTAITNADALWALEEYEFSRGYYQIANEAKPGVQHVENRLAKIDSAIAALQKREKEMLAQRENAKKMNQSIAEDTSVKSGSKSKNDTTNEKEPIWYSVQIGAFYDWMDESAFTDVPQFLIIQGKVYKRCFSGQFDHRSKAHERKNKMVAMGFTDAFIVTMRGKERIGY